jgi:Ca2+-binding RTX toxin-like protein
MALFTGDGFDNTLIGLKEADTINGNGGNDIIRGRGGDDIITGGADNDKIKGDNGDDTIDGGAGNDTFIIAAGEDSITGGSGIDKFVFKGAVGNTIITDYEASEVIDLSNVGVSSSADFSVSDDGTNTTITLAGFTITLEGVVAAASDLSVRYAASARQDGTPGADTFVGDATNENYYGGEGNDTINGGDGNDQVRGDGGDDVVSGGPGDDKVVGGPGTDTVQGDGDNDEVLGGAGDDLVVGGDGNDVVDGQDGDDTVQGGEGNDLVLGDFKLLQNVVGVDVLDGGSGDDTLNAGAAPAQDAFAARDQLTGGDGADTFVFDTSLAHASITDYDQSEGDIIQIDMLGVDSVADISFVSVVIPFVGMIEYLAFGGVTVVIDQPNDIDSIDDFTFDIISDGGLLLV